MVSLHGRQHNKLQINKTNLTLLTFAYYFVSAICLDPAGLSSDSFHDTYSLLNCVLTEIHTSNYANINFFKNFYTSLSLSH
jgi:hypothetical protein